MSARTSPVGPDRGAVAHSLRRAVAEAQAHRDVGLLGDPVEPRLPVLLLGPGALHRDDQPELLGRRSPCCELLDHALWVAAVHGEPADAAHERTHRTTEQLLLGQEVRLDAGRPGQPEHQGEVPRGGVRRGDHDHDRIRRGTLAGDRPPTHRQRPGPDRPLVHDRGSYATVGCPRDPAPARRTECPQGYRRPSPRRPGFHERLHRPSPADRPLPRAPTERPPYRTSRVISTVTTGSALSGPA